MQVVAQSPPATAPASPNPFVHLSSGYNYFYASAPASPSRAAAIYQEFAFGNWEEPPARGPQASFFSDDGFDFSIGFSGQLDGEAPATALATADELFEEGKIRPLNSPRLSSTSAPKGKEEARRERGRSSPSSNTTTGRRGTRSLSPNIRGERDDQLLRYPNPDSYTSYSPASNSSSLTKSGGGGGSKKWSFKDLFLFRSASEGRATGRGSKDFLHKHTLILPSSSSPKPSSFLTSIFGKRRQRGEETRSNGGSSVKSVPNSPRRGGGGGRTAAAAHEMQYMTLSKGAAEEMRKKTPLAYQSNSMFDCLRLNPAIQGLTREFAAGSSYSRRLDQN